MSGEQGSEVAIREYVEDQAGEKVVHLELAASEMVGPVRHEIWDVHCTQSRRWVVTNPTNLYSQTDFKSRDVVLTFHIGLALRVAYLNDRRVPVAPKPAALLPGSWRRWQQAFGTYESGDEAEAFQAVGVHLRECLVSFIGEATDETIVPAATEPPKGADFKGWADLLANQLASGPSAKHLRAYLKKTSDETWELVNWLTHAKNAVRLDGEIALKAVEHLLGVFTAARMRFERENRRCERCGSYDVRGGRCGHCGSVDGVVHAAARARTADGGGAHRTSRGALHAELGHLHVHATAGRRLRSSVPQHSIDLDSEHACRLSRE